MDAAIFARENRAGRAETRGLYPAFMDMPMHSSRKQIDKKCKSL